MGVLVWHAGCYSNIVRIDFFRPKKNKSKVVPTEGHYLVRGGFGKGTKALEANRVSSKIRFLHGQAMSEARDSHKDKGVTSHLPGENTARNLGSSSKGRGS